MKIRVSGTHMSQNVGFRRFSNYKRYKYSGFVAADVVKPLVFKGVRVTNAINTQVSKPPTF